MRSDDRQQDPSDADATTLALDSAELDDLLRELHERVHQMLDQQARQQLLLDAVVSMSADLSLSSVLDRIVHAASALLGADYAALGVLNPASGPRRLKTFVYYGMSDETARAIGALPRGRGLLGVIIDEPRPLRLTELSEHPASSGFPPHHPVMASFLGVPVMIHGRVFGNLYLTDKRDAEEFSAEDEEIAVAFAAAAGVAIENAQLYEEAARRERWLTATAEVTAVLAGTINGADALQTVVDRARDVAQADLAAISSGKDPRRQRLEAVSGAVLNDALQEVLAFARPLASEVVDSGRPVAMGDVVSDARTGIPAPDMPEIGPAILVPIRLGSDTQGVLGLAWTPEHIDRYTQVDSAMPASFAEQASVALTLARAREDRERLAVLEDRDRIGHDLHDLVIQRLFAIGLGLQGTARLAVRPETADRVERAIDDLDATIRDIRRAIFALGATDSAGDIQSEATRLIERAHRTLKFRPTLDFEGPVRSLVTGALAADVLAAMSEALSNAGRHANASAVHVQLTAGDRIVLTVSDDGSGLPDEFTESGLANLRSRARRHGGRFDVASEPSGGTRLTWAVPLPRSDH